MSGFSLSLKVRFWRVTDTTGTGGGVGSRSGSSGYDRVMTEVSPMPSHAQRYEMALFRLAAIDAGAYGAMGRRYRSHLLNEIAELKAQACGRRCSLAGLVSNESG